MVGWQGCNIDFMTLWAHAPWRTTREWHQVKMKSFPLSWRRWQPAEGAINLHCFQLQSGSCLWGTSRSPLSLSDQQIEKVWKIFLKRQEVHLVWKSYYSGLQFTSGEVLKCALYVFHWILYILCFDGWICDNYFPDLPNAIILLCVTALSPSLFVGYNFPRTIAK